MIDIIKDWSWVVPIAYEVFIRLVPTSKDWTLLNKIVNLFDRIPNRYQAGNKRGVIRLKKEVVDDKNYD